MDAVEGSGGTILPLSQTAIAVCVVDAAEVLEGGRHHLLGTDQDLALHRGWEGGGVGEKDDLGVAEVGEDLDFEGPGEGG